MPNAAVHAIEKREPPAQLQRVLVWGAHNVPQLKQIAFERTAPLLSWAKFGRKDIESKVRQAIVVLDSALRAGTFQPTSKQRVKLATLDRDNVMQLWLRPRKPVTLPPPERIALSAVLCAAGQPGLELLWGPQDILVSRFRARCTLIANESWQAAADDHPELRQLLAVLWAMGQGADIALHHTDGWSQAYYKAVIQPLLTVVASEGLDGLPTAARLLASRRGALNRYDWVSSLELSCQDPENFLPESPLAATLKNTAQPAEATAPKEAESALDCFTIGSYPIRAAAPASAQPVLTLPAPREKSGTPRAACTIRALSPAPAAIPPVAPQSVASEHIEHVLTINGQQVRITAAMLQAMAYSAP